MQQQTFRGLESALELLQIEKQLRIGYKKMKMRLLKFLLWSFPHFCMLEWHLSGTGLSGEGNLCHWFAHFKCALPSACSSLRTRCRLRLQVPSGADKCNRCLSAPSLWEGLGQGLECSSLGVVDWNPPCSRRHACHLIGGKVHVHCGFCLNESFLMMSVMSRVTRRGLQGWRVESLLCSVSVTDKSSWPA